MKKPSRSDRLSRRDALARLGYAPPAVVWVSTVAFSAAPSDPPPPPGPPPPDHEGRESYPFFGRGPVQPLRFGALGQAVVVELETARQRRRAQRLFGGYSAAGTSPVAHFAISRGRLIEDGVAVARFDRDDVLLELLEHRVALRVIEAQVDRVALHASSVVRRGRAVLLPGPKQRGKNTLAVRLVQGGFDHAADDCTVLDPDTLSVLPLPRPFNVKPGSTRVLAPWGRRLDAIRARGRTLAMPVDAALARSPATVGAIVFPRFSPGATTRAVCLEPTDALAALLESTFSQTPRELGTSSLARLVESTPAYRLDYSDIRAAAATVSGWV